jgi:hypothetical protein
MSNHAGAEDSVRAHSKFVPPRFAPVSVVLVRFAPRTRGSVNKVERIASLKLGGLLIVAAVVIAANIFLSARLPGDDGQSNERRDASQTREGTRARSGSVEAISLERSGHRPGAPFYALLLKKDGSVRYTGKLHVTRIGTYKATIAPIHFRRLDQMIERFRYFEMDPHIVVDDSDYVTIRVVRGKDEKTFTHTISSTVPIELWAIEMAVDGAVANVADWNKVEAE